MKSRLSVNFWKGWKIDENAFVDHKKSNTEVPFPHQKEIQNSILVGDDMKGKSQGKTW